MAIEIIPKEKEKPNPIKLTIFYVGVSLLIVAIFLSILFYFLEWRALQEREAISDYIKERKTERAISLEREIQRYSEKTTLFIELSEGRRSSGPFFEVMEDMMHPKVFLTDASVNIDRALINVDGFAESIIAFDQQTKILAKEGRVANFNAERFSIEENNIISFPIAITLSNRALRGSLEQ